MLQIVNGGVLPDGWTVDTLLSSHRSMPYNPDIANTFFRAGEVEAWGRGIERIIKGCNEDGFSTVEFRYDACGLWTTFSYQYQKTLCYLALLMRRAAGLRMPTLDVVRGGVLATIDREI